MTEVEIKRYPISNEKLIELSAAQKTIREINGYDPILAEEEMLKMVEYAETRAKNWPTFDLLKYQASNGPCGCMGFDSSKGEFACPCRMSSYLEMYKFDIELLIREKNSE